MVDRFLHAVAEGQDVAVPAPAQHGLACHPWMGWLPHSRVGHERQQGIGYLCMCMRVSSQVGLMGLC